MTSPSKRSPSNRQKAQPRTELRVEPQRAASILDPRALQILTAEHVMNDRTLNAILGNPIYNGWVTRKGERSPAAWRESPAVDELWARVARSLPPALAAVDDRARRSRTRSADWCAASAAWAHRAAPTGDYRSLK